MSAMPKYVTPSKAKVEIPKNLDEFDTIIITQYFPKAVPAENSVVGCVATMKFEDWDLADIEKFPHLAIDVLMEQNVEGMVTTLQPLEWLQKVDKARFLCLLLIPHFLWPSITKFVIKQLLSLAREEILWVGKPVSITTELVHQVSHLPCDGRDPLEIIDRSNDVMMIKKLNNKYQLAKGQ